MEGGGTLAGGQWFLGPPVLSEQQSSLHFSGTRTQQPWRGLLTSGKRLRWHRCLTSVQDVELELKIELSRDKASFAGARSGAVGAVKRRWCPAFSWLSRTAPRHADLTGFGKISEVRNVVIGMLFCVLYN